ncbi:hypothetical protein Tco_0815696 [Tanacetum coccineum]
MHIHDNSDHQPGFHILHNAEKRKDKKDKKKQKQSKPTRNGKSQVKSEDGKSNLKAGSADTARKKDKAQN